MLWQPLWLRHPNYEVHTKLAIIGDQGEKISEDIRLEISPAHYEKQAGRGLGCGAHCILDVSVAHVDLMWRLQVDNYR